MLRNAGRSMSKCKFAFLLVCSLFLILKGFCFFFVTELVLKENESEMSDLDRKNFSLPTVLSLRAGEFKTFSASDLHLFKVYRIESGLDIEVVYDFESKSFAKAFVLSGGHHFRVPRRASHRIWNRSKTKDAVLSWRFVYEEEAQKEWDGEGVLASSTKKSRRGRKSR